MPNLVCQGHTEVVEQGDAMSHHVAVDHLAKTLRVMYQQPASVQSVRYTQIHENYVITIPKILNILFH